MSFGWVHTLADVVGFRYRPKADPGDSQDLLRFWDLKSHSVGLEPRVVRRGLETRTGDTDHQADRTLTNDLVQGLPCTQAEPGPERTALV